MIGKLLCKIGIHSYKLVRDTGVHGYFECKRCSNRVVKRAKGSKGFQPIDKRWLNHLPPKKLKKPSRGSIVRKVQDKEDE